MVILINYGLCIVMPAQAGIQIFLRRRRATLDTSFRWYDKRSIPTLTLKDADGDAEEKCGDGDHKALLN
jgi:hypothetical protein